MRPSRTTTVWPVVTRSPSNRRTLRMAKTRGQAGAPASVTKADDANNLTLHNCLLSIEKAGVVFGPHHEHTVQLYLKTLTGFDSAIQSIKFYGKSEFDEGFTHHEPVVAQPVELFPGAGDFWEIGIGVTGDNDVPVSNTLQHGVFGVNTQKGTFYWLRSADGSDFVFDPPLFDNLANSVRSQGLNPGNDLFGAPASPDLAIFTKGNFPYLNPNNCQ
jgi:hypothetical protein